MNVTAKAKSTPEIKERADDDETPLRNNRSDTWTDTSEPLYDRHGNQVGTYNDPHKAWENDRR